MLPQWPHWKPHLWAHLCTVHSSVSEYMHTSPCDLSYCSICKSHTPEILGPCLTLSFSSPSRFLPLCYFVCAYLRFESELIYVTQMRPMVRVGRGGRDMFWGSYVSRSNGMYRQPNLERWAQPPGSLLSHVLVPQEPTAEERRKERFWLGNSRNTAARSLFMQQ